MSQRKVLKTKYNPITGVTFEFVSQPAVVLTTPKDTIQKKQKTLTSSVHFNQNIRIKHIPTTTNNKIDVITDNNDAYKENKNNNTVNDINKEDVYIDSEKLKQEQLLRAKYEKQKTKYLRQIRKNKEYNYNNH